MQFLNSGIFIGEWWGITVRVHFTLILYGFALATGYGNLVLGLLMVIGLWVCILLHEYGHAFAARWCDGECENILLWPLGGLAFCRTAFNPTAHLITAAAGPFVTLLLWGLFWGLSWLLAHVVSDTVNFPSSIYIFVATMREWNFWMLIFNVCTPAFPLDGGRIFRDTLWHFVSAETATRIAVVISQLVAFAALTWGIGMWVTPESVPNAPMGFGPIGLLILAGFILLQTSNEKQIVAAEALGAYEFSIRERIKRGQRKRAFHRAVREREETAASEPFHRCHVCGRTDDEDPSLEFRVCTDCLHGEEYCKEHLDNHKHVVS